MLKLLKNKKAVLAIVALVLLLGTVIAVIVGANLQEANKSAADVVEQFEDQDIALDGVIAEGDLDGLSTTQSLSINGQLNANNSIVIAPTSKPKSTTAGQLYFDGSSDKLVYYDGGEFIPLAGTNDIDSLQGQLENLATQSQTSALSAQLQALQSQVDNTQTPSGIALLSGKNKFSAQNTFNAGLSASSLEVSGQTNLGPSTISSLVLSNPLAVSSGGTGRTSLPLNGVLIGQGTGAVSSVTAGATGQCLISTAGAPTFQACPGGGGGVDSLNGIAGAVTLANASAAGSTVTINNASTASKGIAQFNASNFTVASGNVNTIQNISVSSTPTFAGLNLTGNLDIAGNSIVTSGATISAGELNVLDGGLNEVEISGVITDVTAGSGLTGGAASGNATVNIVSANAGILVGANDIALTLQPTADALSGTTSSGSGLEITAGGLSLIQGCADSEILKWNETTDTWSCGTDAGGSGVGDDVQVNGSNATNANFIDTTASGSATGVTWSLNTGPSPDAISIAIANASPAQAGAVTTGAQAFAGDKTFNNALTVTGLFTANGGITLEPGDTLNVNGDAITDLSGNGLAVSGGVLQTTLGTSIDSSEIVDGTIATIDIADSQINSAKIADGSVSSTDIADGTITGTDIANDSIALGTKTTGNYVSDTNAGTGIAISGSGGEGSTPTIALDYSSNLSSNSLGVNQSSFAATGILFEGSTSDSFETLLQAANPTADNTITLPDASGTVCLTSGNCAGVGGGVTTSGGTINTLAKFTAAQGIGDSSISDDGTTVSTTGNLVVQGGNVTAGTVSQLGSFILHDGNGQTTTLRAGNSGGNLTFILPTGAGSQYQCLKYDTAGQLIWDDCEGGSGGTPVSSLNSLTGDLSIQGNAQIGVSASNPNINLSINADSIGDSQLAFNTGQHLTVSSTPTFAGLSVGGDTITDFTGTGLSVSGGALNTTLGTNVDSGEIVDGTITGTDIADDTIALGTKTTGNYVAGTNAGTGIAITGSGGEGSTPTISLDYTNSLASNSLGVNQSSFAATGILFEGSSADAFETLFTVANPTADNTITLPDASGTVCLTSGNCAGVGGGVTTAGGTTNVLAKFTAGQAIGDSSISDDGSTVATTGNLVVQGGNVTAGTGSQFGSFILHDGNGQTTTLRAGDSGSNISFTLPTNTGSQYQCLKYDTGGQLIWDDCDGGGGGGSGVTSLNGLSGGVSIQGNSQIGVSPSSPNINLSINADSIGDAQLAFNTGQHLTVSSTPSFAGLDLTGDLDIAANNIVTSGATISSSELNVLDGGIAEGEVSGVITDVTAGNGLTGGAGSGNATVNIASANGGIVVGADNITLTLQPAGDGLSSTTSSGSGLEILGGGLSLLQGCTGGEVLKWNETSDAWECAADAGGSGVGDDVFVNNSGVNGANFVNTTATGSVTGVTWGLNTSPNPDEISITIGNASDTVAGAVSTGVQAFAGDKTFNNALTVEGLVTANGGITLQNGETLIVNGDPFTDLTGTGLLISGGSLQTSLGTSIDSSEIVDGAIATADIGDDQITSIKIADGTITGTDIANDTIALGTKTTGNYVAGTNAGTGIAITGSGSEGATPTISLDYSSDLSTNSLGVNQSSFAATGLLFEGSSADAFETLFTVANPTADNTITLPNASGTVCLTTGNCAGAGGGVTTSGGTTNVLAKFTGGQAIGDSSISDDGSTVSTTGNLVIQGGNITAGTGSQLGSLVLHDGNGQTTTLRAGNSGGNLTFVLPTGAGSQYQCLKYDTAGQLIWDDCEGGSGGDSGVTAVNGLTGGITIQGNAQIGVSPSSPNINLSINADSIGDSQLAFNTGQHLTVSSTPTFAGLIITGDTTANRPASPSTGQLFYDQTTGQLLVYTGTFPTGKWQADRTSVSKTVAPSNAPQYIKDSADYVATGTSDQTTINTALTAASGGKVYLFEGTFTTDNAISVPNNTMLTGSGNGTVIQFANIVGLNRNMIVNTDTSTGAGVTVRDLKLDGNKAVNTSGTQLGVYLSGVGNYAADRKGAVVQNVTAQNFITTGIRLDNSSQGSITNSSTNNNGGSGITLLSSSHSTVKGNTSSGNGGTGVNLSSATNNTISGNTTNNNTQSGFNLGSSSTQNTVTSNTATANTGSGISLTTSSSQNTISANTTNTNGGSGISLNSVTENTLTGNTANSNTAHGVSLTSASENTLTGNTANSNTNNGFALSSSVRNTITGSTAKANTLNGILLGSSSDDNVISAASIYNNGGSGANSGIAINTSSNNQITDNHITDTAGTGYAISVTAGSNTNYLASNVFSGTGAASINDGGTGTIFGGQVNNVGDYRIQPAGDINLATDTNVTNGNLTVGSSSIAGNLSISDGSSNNATIVVEPLAGNYTVTIPTITANDEFCLKILTNCTASTNTLQEIYDASTPAEILLSDGKDFKINTNDTGTDPSIVFNLQCGSCSAGGGRFAVQDAGVDIFTVNPNADIVFGTGGNTVTFSGSAGTFEPILAGNARHSKSIVLTPEYVGAVLDAASDASCTSANSGTMTSAYDSANRMNYYNWTSTQGTAQCYDVVLQVPIPSDWHAWDSSPVNIQMKRDSTGTAAYAVQILRSNGSADTTFCSGGGYCTTPTSGFAALGTSWGNMTTNSLSGSNYIAGDYFTIKVRMSSTSNANVSLGNITLNYKSKW